MLNIVAIDLLGNLLPVTMRCVLTNIDAGVFVNMNFKVFVGVVTSCRFGKPDLFEICC